MSLPRDTRTTRARGLARTGYVIAILLNLLFLSVANNLLRWRVPFITAQWSLVLWAVNLSTVASILAYVLFLAFDPPWFKHLVQIGLNVFSLLVLYLTYMIFPFNFGGGLDTLVRFALIVALAGAAIAALVEMGALVMGLVRG